MGQKGLATTLLANVPLPTFYPLRVSQLTICAQFIFVIFPW